MCCIAMQVLWAFEMFVGANLPCIPVPAQVLQALHGSCRSLLHLCGCWARWLLHALEETWLVVGDGPTMKRNSRASGKL